RTVLKPSALICLTSWRQTSFFLRASRSSIGALALPPPYQTAIGKNRVVPAGCAEGSASSTGNTPATSTTTRAAHGRNRSLIGSPEEWREPVGGRPGMTVRKILQDGVAVQRAAVSRGALAPVDARGPFPYSPPVRILSRKSLGAALVALSVTVPAAGGRA